MPSVVTANLLETGDVVYLGPAGKWLRDLGDAEVANDKAELAQLDEIAQRAVAAREVTAVYAMDVSTANGRPTPLSVREKIRAAHGPTV
jgi:hypothetical protein